MKLSGMLAALLAAAVFVPLAAEAQAKPPVSQKGKAATASSSSPSRVKQAVQRATFKLSAAARMGQSNLAAKRNTKSASISKPKINNEPCLECEASTTGQTAVTGAAARQRLTQSGQSAWRASGTIRQINSEGGSP